MASRLVTVMLVAGWFAVNGWGQAIEEYQVKAAFLYNFAKFVEWPSQTFLTSKDPITVCVLGHNPFGNALEEVIHGKSIDGRSFAYRQVSDAESASACQILFVSSVEGKRFRSLCANLRPAGILTVGEAPGFAADGGVINFKLDGGHVRFEINVDAAEREQLHISSKLLSLAQIVRAEKLR
jgi:hypothetical protein